MAVKTPIEQGMIARVVAGVRYAFTGEKPNEWFSPLAPVPSVVPENQMESVEGRAFDYGVGYNTRISPRQGEPISFSQMRALADNYDLLRIVIETRKDQVAKMKWTIKPIDDKKDADPRCDELKAFFRFPDKENSWEDWVRMMMEDMLVTDAVSIYARPNRGGKVYSFELIDGATVTRKIDARGRTPQPPEIAYQQILHGVPAAEYTKDELLYAPRNKRVHKAYGYSPVEQIIMTVNIALRRQIHQVQYYTEGSTPDLIFSVPPEWNPDQTRKFKEYWEEQLSGNTASRRGTMFVPNGVTTVNTKESALKDEYDEWLARVVCYAFSVPPTAFVKQNNRATADNATDQGLSEGLVPIMTWVKGIIDKMIVGYFGYTDLQFDWVDDRAIDPLEQAQINQIYIDKQVLTPDEVRIELGREALTPQERETAFRNEAVAPQLDENGQPIPSPQPKQLNAPNATKKADFLTKSKKKVSTIDRERKSVTKQAATLKKILKTAFEAVAQDVANQVSSLINKIDMTAVQKILDEIDFAGLVVLAGDFEAVYEAVAKDGAIQALVQIGITDDEMMVNLVNEKAVEWAKARGAEMVGKKIDSNGDLVENPNARWRIDESTRDMLRADVAQAIEEGWSNDKLAEQLAGNYAFSDERADTIARTETAYADVQGNLIAYNESGVVEGKEWITGAGCCDDCDELDGEVVALGDDFPNGAGDAPPYHPNCRCDLLPVLTDNNESE